MLDKKNQIVAAVILKGKRVLIAQRPSNDKEADLWEFPGGCVNSQEDKKTALKREIKEELKIDVEVLDKITTRANKEKELHFHLCKAQGQIKKSLFHKRLRWVKLVNLKYYKFCRLDKLALEEILNFLKTGGRR